MYVQIYHTKLAWIGVTVKYEICCIYHPFIYEPKSSIQRFEPPLNLLWELQRKIIETSHVKISFALFEKYLQISIEFFLL